MILYIILWYISGFIGTILMDYGDRLQGCYSYRGYWRTISVLAILIHLAMALTGPCMFIIGVFYTLKEQKFWSTPIYDLLKRQK